MTKQLFNGYTNEETNINMRRKDLDSNIVDHYEKYDFENNLQCLKNSKCIHVSLNKPYQIIKQPQILDNFKFYNILRQLNKEQERIMKDVNYQRKHVTLANRYKYFLQEVQELVKHSPQKQYFNH